MDGPWRNYAKQNKSHKERQILYDLLYLHVKCKKQTNKKIIVTGGKKVVAKGRGIGEWTKWVNGVKIYKLTVTK